MDVGKHLSMMLSRCEVSSPAGQLILILMLQFLIVTINARYYRKSTMRKMKKKWLLKINTRLNRVLVFFYPKLVLKCILRTHQ